MFSYFIKNPNVSYAISLVLIIIGLVSFLHLPITALPSIANNSIMIETNCIGASPSFMEKAVTQPLEDAIYSIDGIDTIRSFSSTGESHLHVTFKPGVDFHEVINRIQSAISLVQNKLPKEVAIRS